MILSYFKRGKLIPAGRVERELRELEGIEEITINHLCHSVKVRYDPRHVTAEKIQSAVKRIRASREHRNEA